jgi:hypothetical protein
LDVFDREWMPNILLQWGHNQDALWTTCRMSRSPGDHFETSIGWSTNTHRRRCSANFHGK